MEGGRGASLNLWDDGEAFAEVVEPNGTNVDAVNPDETTRCFNDAEE
jgi:hypothetical protein